MNNELIKERLINFWKNTETKKLASIFEQYMNNMGVRKLNRRRKNNKNTYLIDGKSTGWNRVSCYYYKNSEKYSEEELSMTLRKKSGNYFIVEKHGIRCFEIDYSDIRHYDENLLNEVIEENKDLFKMMGII
ncbi:zinc ribbon domain-containing protein [Clostridium perfringens]|uniref:zinc ribbon domain-containing protein n=1 Tax=Clostridium perfringens TaxID=1502 RepID=UPI001FAA548C|nr:zinc ribbon domain-containing protein [Clostridium perfringens]